MADDKTTGNPKAFTKTKSGSYVPGFMRVDQGAGAGATPTAPPAQQTQQPTPAVQAAAPQVQQQPQTTAPAPVAQVQQQPQTTAPAPVAQVQQPMVTEEPTQSEGKKKKEKDYKPKKFEELVDKSAENYVVPLELSNKKIYIFALIILILVVVSSFTIFYLRAKQSPEGAGEVTVEVVQ